MRKAVNGKQYPDSSSSPIGLRTWSARNARVHSVSAKCGKHSNLPFFIRRPFFITKFSWTILQVSLISRTWRPARSLQVCNRRHLDSHSLSLISWLCQLTSLSTRRDSRCQIGSSQSSNMSRHLFMAYAYWNVCRKDNEVVLVGGRKWWTLLLLSFKRRGSSMRQSCALKI